LAALLQVMPAVGGVLVALVQQQLGLLGLLGRLGQSKQVGGGGFATT